MFGKLKSIHGRTLEIELPDDLNILKLIRLADNKQPTVELNIPDKRKITPDQRKKIWALINDFCYYTGDVPKAVEESFKYKTSLDFGIKLSSLSNCSISEANLMMLEILDFLFEEDIPFKTKTWDSIPNYFPKQMLCIKNRTCVICGRKNADLAHFKTVGIGRNRHDIDERKMYFMTLCRAHHTEQHKIGINSFMQKYHLKPIRLSNDDLIRFKILTKQRLKELEELK
ncbi:MAG: putative HNHc nuclease [Liquorilactobacillus ghanensis]|uniref:putative HNHc nuclease n=1 Tax=Liquorilactobacillus ghanensis TaxID=399370 RepID=UPI0039E82693